MRNNPIVAGTDAWGWTTVLFYASPEAYIEIQYSTQVKDCIATYYMGGDTIRKTKGEVKDVLTAISVWNDLVVPYVASLGINRINVVVEDKDDLKDKRIRLYKRMGFVVHPNCADDPEKEIEMFFVVNRR